MKQLFIGLCALLCTALCPAQTRVINLSDYGVKPNCGKNSSALMADAIRQIRSRQSPNDTLILRLSCGRYDFYPADATEREYFISNHDQDNPKRVGIPLEDLHNVVFDGQGAELIFHGRMLPVSLLRSENCSLQNFSIDFANPHITQITVLENDMLSEQITYQVAPWAQYEVCNGVFVAKGEGWEHTPVWAIAFEGGSRRVLYHSGDIAVGIKDVKELAPGKLTAPWENKQLAPGTVIALRSTKRPAPGIFVSHAKDVSFKNIQVHYAEGMGLLAQFSENISLDGFSVCLRGRDDPRYFTTQADATHFSGCKGHIRSVNGLYEGMMDDAINVHGTYLRVERREDDYTLLGRYMHSQTYGFDWGECGDSVQFIRSRTMEIVGQANRIASIQAADRANAHGAKLFRIKFEKPLDTMIQGGDSIGMENLEWSPTVYFAGNVVRNNRARGALFSTPRRTVVENNTFDHTSGTAILLCGDCNGWYETGACHDVLIRNNRFVNALTSLYQFTNAVISIYPEIPDLHRQQQYFHSNIIIENNLFETFDCPILYAKSVESITFRNNIIKQNGDYPPFHPNNYRIYFQRVSGAEMYNNQLIGEKIGKEFKMED